jgi:ketosteroid isomerase-like protein
MSAEENKAIVRHFYEEVWNKGNYAVADALFALDGVRHDHATAGPNNPEIQKGAAAANRALMPDLHLTVENIVAEGDWVAARWRIEGTHRQTGKRIKDYTAQNMWRLKEGKIVEVRNNRDDLMVFHELGLIPSRADLWKQAGLKSSPYVQDGTARAQQPGSQGPQVD